MKSEIIRQNTYPYLEVNQKHTFQHGYVKVFDHEYPFKDLVLFAHSGEALISIPAVKADIFKGMLTDPPPNLELSGLLEGSVKLRLFGVQVYEVSGVNLCTAEVGFTYTHSEISIDHKAKPAKKKRRKVKRNYTVDFGFYSLEIQVRATSAGEARKLAKADYVGAVKKAVESSGGFYTFEMWRVGREAEKKSLKMCYRSDHGGFGALSFNNPAFI